MKRALLVLLTLSTTVMTLAQNNEKSEDTTSRKQWNAAFQLQTDIHASTRKGATSPTANTYLTGAVANAALEIGGRYEHLTRPLPGHEAERGHGLAHLYLKLRPFEWAELTLGDFYEQLGSGLVLRAYEDRDLGIDNALRGARLLVRPLNGLTLKALGGQQRRHFDRAGRIFSQERGRLGAADAEYLHTKGEHQWMLGASALVNRDDETPIYQLFPDQTYKRFRQPRHYGVFAGRFAYTGARTAVYFEHAYRTNHPNAINHYTQRSGQAQMLTLSYAHSGKSILLGLRRSDNFDNHTLRSQTDNDLRLNHLLPFTPQHAHTLAALYPYPSQPQSEWAYQAEGRYQWKRGTALGGRHGTKLKVAAAYAASLRGTPYSQQPFASQGTAPKYFGHGEKLYHDFTVEVSKKISNHYAFVAQYSHQSYNQTAIEGHASHGNPIRSHIFAYEGKHRLAKKWTLRTEAQYLATQQADGDWLFGLAEISVAPRLLFAVSDLWNAGRTKRHYPMLSVAATHGNHRLQLSYGKTREGINCSGGVCRLMPATEGWTMSYLLNF